MSLELLSLETLDLIKFDCLTVVPSTCCVTLVGQNFSVPPEPGTMSLETLGLIVLVM